MPATALKQAGFSWSLAEAPLRYQAPEAFLTLASLAAGIDGGMSVLESEYLQQLTRRWWERGVLRERDLEALGFAVCERLSEGRDAIIAAAAAALPEACGPALYAQALDIMLANGPMTVTEESLSLDLARALKLKEDDARGIRAIMEMKNAY